MPGFPEWLCWWLCASAWCKGWLINDTIHSWTWQMWHLEQSPPHSCRCHLSFGHSCSHTILTLSYGQLFTSTLPLSVSQHHVSISRLWDTVSLWWHKLMTAFATLLLVNICWIIQDACNVNCYMTSGFCMLMTVPSMIFTVKWLQIAFWTHTSCVTASNLAHSSRQWIIWGKLLLNNSFLCFVFLWLLLLTSLLFIYFFTSEL